MTRKAIILNNTFSPQELTELAQAAEEAGFESAWTNEGLGRDAFTSAATMAARTRRIRVGTGIVALYTRTPVLMAMSAWSVHEISGGRFLLGLGTSHSSVMGVHGLDVTRPLATMREVVDIVRTLTRGERVAADGEVYQLRDAQLALDTSYRTPLPIYLGVLNPRMVRLAGETADGVLLNLATPQYVRGAVETLAQGAAAAGRTAAEVDVSAFVTVAIDDDRTRALRYAKRQVASYTRFPFYRSLYARCGFQEEMTWMERAWQQGEGERAGEKLPDRMAEAIALMGTPHQCRDQLGAFLDAGLRLPVLSAVDGTGRTPQAAYAALRAFADY
ncbi:MAG: LLM class flavin-dependent oxidoreductase [Chloroflexi bacterium]|nr:LLM class flavin-dependent oxidoreductase [Chloroflexota bacterium]